MPQKKRRSPQEKKALSYAKDRRNDYGENDKAARKIIPLRKAKANRAVRRGAKLALAGGDDAPPFLKGRWRKAPDAALGMLLERRERQSDTQDWREEFHSMSPEEWQAYMLRERLRRLRT